ncbi:MAG: hypothetical protein ACI9JM_000299 [Halioglobus sp.]|jgi:hypothetical protein
MLNQLLKFTLVSSVLLWLRPRWRGLLSLSVFVILVHIFHGEYLDYVALSDDQSLLVWSFVIKWFALLGSIIAYFVFAVAGFKFGASGGDHSSAQGDGTKSQVSGGSAGDGFDFLRQKEKLQSRSEKVLTGGSDKTSK